jgi:hypothetical protein
MQNAVEKLERGRNIFVREESENEEPKGENDRNPEQCRRGVRNL